MEPINDVVFLAYFVFILSIWTIRISILQKSPDPRLSRRRTMSNPPTCCGTELGRTLSRSSPYRYWITMWHPRSSEVAHVSKKTRIFGSQTRKQDPHIPRSRSHTRSTAQSMKFPTEQKVRDDSFVLQNTAEQGFKRAAKIPCTTTAQDSDMHKIETKVNPTWLVHKAK